MMDMVCVEYCLGVSLAAGWGGLWFCNLRLQNEAAGVEYRTRPHASGFDFHKTPDLFRSMRRHHFYRGISMRFWRKKRAEKSLARSYV